MAIGTISRLKIEVGARPASKFITEDSEQEVFRLNWNVEIRISLLAPNTSEGFSWEGIRNIEDPFSTADHVEVESYLNESLKNDEFRIEDAARISGMLDRYRESLFDQLGQRNRIQSRKYGEVEFHVYDYSASPPAPIERNRSISIHSLQWEHLEELSLWRTASPHGVTSVTVRRRIGMMPPTGHPQFARHFPSQWRDGRVNILLVVARRGVYEPEPEDFSNPATIQCALLRLQAEILEKGSPFRIHVEVVRPGSFGELSNHLTLRANQHGPNFFQIVHFDLHGGVSRSGRAILEFNEYGANQKLTSKTREAHDIAELLKAHGIGCAILGACKSAQADADVHANLSWALIRSGTSNVLAMSFNMPDSMSEKFFSCFYHQFLLNGIEFGEAASVARLQLFKDRDRRHHKLKRDFRLQDWFVPVVYSNGKRLSFQRSMAQATVPRMFLGYVAVTACVSILILRLGVEIRLSMRIIRLFCYSLPLGVVLLGVVLLGVVPWRWVIRRRQQQLSKRLDSERLAINLLRVEGDLKRANAIFFYCSDDMRKVVTPFLDALVEVWKRTHFVEGYKVVHAEWFLETDRVTLLRHRWRWLFNRACHNVRRPFAEVHGSSKPRSLVIVKNMGILYPERTELTENHLDARNRMFAWLEANFSKDPRRTRPYLVVVVGGKRYWDERRIGTTCQVLRSAARTEFANRYS